MDADTSQRHIELQSDFAALNDLISEVDAFVRSHTPDEDLAYKVVLLTTEAATNAIEHGNRLDPSKKVTVDLQATPSSIEVSVEDEGSGFDAGAVKDPLQESNLLEEGGRGIFLIETMADEYAYELDGRRIKMVFRL